MQIVNSVLAERSRGGMFATTIYALLDMGNGLIQVANAGHHSILIRDMDHSIVKKGKSGGTPLGIRQQEDYPSEKIKLDKSNLLLFYTDGALEPKNDEGEEFGMGRLKDQIISHPESPE